MTVKLFVPSTALLLLSLSGCCRLFGICTSASVHTSISSPRLSQQADGTGYLDALDEHLLAQTVQRDRCVN